MSKIQRQIKKEMRKYERNPPSDPKEIKRFFDKIGLLRRQLTGVSIKNRGEVERKTEVIRQEAVALRRIYTPRLMEIQHKYLQTTKTPIIKFSSWVCPKCGSTNATNLMNGRPWCFTCKTFLERVKKPKKRK